MQCPDGVCRQIARTAIERQQSPSATKGRPTSVPILQSQQPANRCRDGVSDSHGRLTGPSQGQQGQDRPRRVVGVRHAPGQIGPSPASGRRICVGMRLSPLLVQQPLLQGRSEVRWQFGPQRIDRQGGDPGRQVRIDRPTAIGPHRLQQKLQPALGDRVSGLPQGGKAHRDETGQRRRLQVAPRGGLNLLQHPQAGSPRRVPDPPRQWIPGRAHSMPHLANRDQCGERVRHNRQADRLVEPLGETGQLKRQSRNLSPLNQPGQGAVGQDGDRKRAIATVAGQQCRDTTELEDGCLRTLQGSCGNLANRLPASGPANLRQRRPHEHGRRDIGVAEGCVSPASVRALLRDQPVDSSCQHAAVDGHSLVSQLQQRHQCRARRERRGGQFPHPVPIGPWLGEQRRDRLLPGRVESVPRHRVRVASGRHGMSGPGVMPVAEPSARLAGNDQSEAPRPCRGAGKASL